MSLANASHENHPYSQYKGLQVQGCEENHEKPTAGNKGKNIALTALESPATRAWVNSCSKAAKSDSKAANGSASQWLQGTVQEQNVFWLDLSLFQNLEKQKQQQKKALPNTLFTALKTLLFGFQSFQTTNVCIFN